MDQAKCFLKFRCDLYQDGVGRWYLLVDGKLIKVPAPDISKIEANGNERFAESMIPQEKN